MSMKQVTVPIILLISIFLISFKISAEEALESYYGTSYALVIGINKYPSSNWENLDYAVKDAKGMEAFLKNQGFEIISLYNKHATKKNIISKMQNYIARLVQTNDRVIIFFSGHGYTEHLGGKDWGYIVPYDAEGDSASYISMEELRVLSQEMGIAKHQLFIMDACYSGLLGSKGGGVDPNIPNYIKEVTRRPARQIITAGGKGEQVADGGSNGYSFFTGYLLEALKESLADLDGDGYITFKELSSYLISRASNALSTPTALSLHGHGLGEFVFESTRGVTKKYKNQYNLPDSHKGPGPLKMVVTEKEKHETPLVSKAKFRFSPKEEFSKTSSIKEMIRQYNFFCKEYNWTKGYSNPNGSGFDNKFEKQNSGQTIYDQASDLMWQQSGFAYTMSYNEAKSNIAKLNLDKFAGYNDWRLPTLEEAMSLMEPTEMSGDLHIDPMFDNHQRYIWTADLYSAHSAWVVYFCDGQCYYNAIGYNDSYVRAVR